MSTNAADLKATYANLSKEILVNKARIVSDHSFLQDKLAELASKTKLRQITHSSFTIYGASILEIEKHLVHSYLYCNAKIAPLRQTIVNVERRTSLNPTGSALNLVAYLNEHCTTLIRPLRGL